MNFGAIIGLDVDRALRAIERICDAEDPERTHVATLRDDQGDDAAGTAAAVGEAQLDPEADHRDPVADRGGDPGVQRPHDHGLEKVS